jgi:UDP-glucose:(heptosyl)LPS alpha-1,3-glucosyltransferase
MRKHREILALEKKLFTPEATRLVIANSNFVRDEIIGYFNYPAEQIHVVYNGLPLEKFRFDPATRAKARNELGIADGQFVALLTGSDWERKGLRFAIEGVERATKSKPLLLVAGRGNPRRMKQSERVKFLGPINNIERVLAAADVFVLPTIYDPFSNACLEALAMGLPVITTNANGFSEIIEPGVEGEVIASPHDTEAISAALEKWSDPARRDTIRPRLLALASKFDIATNLDATLALLRQIQNP